jgi:hypothetical protein
VLLEKFHSGTNCCLPNVQTLRSARETSTGDDLEERLCKLDIHAIVIAEKLHSSGNLSRLIWGIVAPNLGLSGASIQG